MPDKQIFSHDYDVPSGTTGDPTPTPDVEHAESDMSNMLSKEYGVDKPKRETIRGKILP